MRLIKGKKVAAILILTLVLALGIGTASAFAGTSISRYTGATYNHNDRFFDAILVDGVDVSYIQKTDIDWAKAKADGVDFAIIRVGARGYGSGKLLVDDYYKENIEAAKAAGVMVGAYFFSQAIDPMEAWAEANYTLELLEGYELDLPVFMDYEFAGGSSGRLTNAQLNKLKMTQNVESFCETITEGGREVGLYANLNFLNNTVNGAALSEKYPIWVAQYNTVCNYQNTYDFWQYTSSGSVAGYGNRLDMNYMYLPKIPQVTSMQSIAEASVSILGASNFTYQPGAVHTPAVTVSYAGWPLYEGVDYDKFYLKNAQAGTGYVLIKGKGLYTDYKLVPFNIGSSGDIYGITADRLLNMYYNGTPRLPKTLPLKGADGRALIKDLDYTFTVSNNTEVGTATVNVTFIGNYTGHKTLTYQIIKGTQNITAPKTVFDVTMDDQTFSLGAITSNTGAKLSFESLDKNIATVDGNGIVTAEGVGSTIIRVTAPESKNYKAASLDIKVNIGASAQKILTETDRYSVKQLSKPFVIKAESNVGSKLTFESSDTSVVKVDSSGKVTLMGPGTCEVLIKAAATEEYGEAKSYVTVEVVPLPENVYAEKYEKLKQGVEKTKVVLLKAYPEKDRVKLTWKKSNSGYSVDYFQLWRSTKKTSGFKKLYTSKSGAGKVFNNVKDVNPNTTYWYKVRGVRNIEGKLIYTPFTKIEVRTKK